MTEIIVNRKRLYNCYYEYTHYVQELNKEYENNLKEKKRYQVPSKNFKKEKQNI